ncbi:MAG: class I SAM-dependent methyltransferase [Candidatus Omnitrophica bacterium]|nr:class I SAM-dependent methyltransferase [Candidatus Omnitrophota bacterium]
MAVAYEKRIQTEIEHGRKLSARAEKIWNWEGAIGEARKARRSAFLSGVLRPGVKCLELGCGTGLFSQGLAPSGAEITAIDISPDLLVKARARVPSVRFLERDACRTGFEDASFDAVVGSSILHHLELDLSLREIHRVLKGGGEIRFTEPNLLNPHIFIQKTVPFVKEKMGDSKYETAFVRGTLEKKLRRAGFRDVKIVPFDFLYPFFPDRWLAPLTRLNAALEGVPFLREIAGSLHISARK